MSEENEPIILKSLCPELREAFLAMAKHFNDCERCKNVLAGHGAIAAMPYMLSVQRVLHHIQTAHDLLDVGTEKEGRA